MAALDPDSDGPDGSSIRPVSSLRARFENMSRPADAPAAAAAAAPHRPISPAPKIDTPRDANPAREPPAVPLKTKLRDSVNGFAMQLPTLSDAFSRPSNRLGPPPPLSPRPIPPPSLLVEPPQSPPKGRVLNLAIGDQPSFLNADAIVKPASPAASPRQFKIPSRPHTPTLDLRRSPRLSPSQPPSPPPPRRSAELRREREARVAPPPVNRVDKPKIPAHHALGPENGLAADLALRDADRRSPFSSPPHSSSESVGDETPPTLPARPKLPAAKILHTGSEPPPIHYSLVAKRMERDQDLNGSGRAPVAPQLTGESRPPLPTRPQTVADVQPLVRSSTVAARPPPRPPRPGTVLAISLAEDAGGLTQKRVVSTPATSYPPPPARSHGRSMTIDRTSSSAPSDTRSAPALVLATSAESRVVDSVLVSSSRSDSATAYPDCSSTNRRPPYVKQGMNEIQIKYDSRIFDVCGELVCTSGHLTRVWSLLDGEQLLNLPQSEGTKATSVAFKPGANVDEEGARLWIGTNVGELMEADIATQNIVCTKPAAHSRQEVIKIYRHYTELWTLDDGGTLHVWGPDDDGTPNLNSIAHHTYRVPKAHTFSMVVGDELWHATGKEVRVFLPTTDGKAQFQVLVRALFQESAGDVTAGALLTADQDKVFLGHNDGKVSIYSRRDYGCLGVVNVGTHKINSLAGVGQQLWAGYSTGKICVYDIEQTPWVVAKEWQAHDNPVVKIIADRSSFYKLDRYQVVSLGADNMLRAWDGLLQEDWLENEMRSRDTSYCDFDDMKALVLTWNAGASTPNSLRYSDSDAGFIQNLLQSSDSPDVLVFSFQELVDLEDKTATAKRLLKPKKKEGSDQERMSHQYRDWRDFLVRSLDDYMAGDLYHLLLPVAHLVGLFTCVFVKADLRDRIRNFSTAEVKRGMGGLHGNKGAIVVRFTIDDTSLCFVNCHLAAGQSQANHRHTDIAAILESAVLPIERDLSVRLDNYVSGGDGTMILDHELCVLNGDLNYRVDTMSRDTVVAAVKANNLAKLLERDQLLVARRRNPGFRLRAFEELPITFAPTYKYDVGTDNYDSSEKKRSPAWCDRILFRGRDIQQVDYRRHEVRVSDHRPVTGRFRFRVKRINHKKKAAVWTECQQKFEGLKDREAHHEKMHYLSDVIGYDPATSKSLIQEKSSRRRQRSPSRHRE